MTAAARRAEDSIRTADAAGRENLGELVAATIAEREKVMCATTGVKREDIITELKRIAFSDPSQLVSWGPDGVRLRASEDLSADAVAAVAEVSEIRTKDGVFLKVRMHNRAAARKLLGAT